MCKVQILITLYTLHFTLVLVAGRIQLSNFGLIRDIAKVVDFIESSIV